MLFCYKRIHDSYETPKLCGESLNFASFSLAVIFIGIKGKSFVNISTLVIDSERNVMKGGNELIQ